MDRQLIQQFLLTCIIPPPTSQPPKRAKTERRKRMWGASTVYSLRRPMHSSMHIIYRRRNTYFLLSVQKTEWLQLMGHVHGWRPQYITRSQSVLGLCCPPHQRSFLVTTVLQFCCPPSPITEAYWCVASAQQGRASLSNPILFQPPKRTTTI